MRTVYTGLYYGENYAEPTAKIAQMTHCDEVSTDICVKYADLICNKCAGQAKLTLVAAEEASDAEPDSEVVSDPE